ncbi:MAG: response regulator transcription factor [Chloroflexi bacterium]|nr:response regulator transcription factor [Chloroflexota bacterium]
MDKIRVLIVDDHAMVRQGIATFIELQDDIELVGEAANGREAMARVAQLRPDVVLMDLVMPEMDGVTATREIRARHPEVKVLALTSFVNDTQIAPVLQAGAAGYLLKDLSAGELMQAIRAAYRGETPLAPAVAKKLVEGIAAPRAEPDALAQLTEREREVLALLGRGLSNKEIAAQLSISEKTAKFHVSGILGKLRLADRTQAALFAAKHGLG